MSHFVEGVREPSPTDPQRREFLDRRRVPYGNLQQIRDAMVRDDIRLIDGIANRRRRDALAVAERAAVGVTVDASDYARHRVADIVEQRYPQERGLLGLVEVVYVQITPEDSVIQLYDYPIVDALAARLQKAKFATAFKWDKGEGIAPAQQARNIERAVSLATERHPEDPGLQPVVGDAYRALVPHTVAIQQEEFALTQIIPDYLYDFGALIPDGALVPLKG